MIFIEEEKMKMLEEEIEQIKEEVQTQHDKMIAIIDAIETATDRAQNEVYSYDVDPDWFLENTEEAVLSIRLSGIGFFKTILFSELKKVREKYKKDKVLCESIDNFIPKNFVGH